MKNKLQNEKDVNKTWMEKICILTNKEDVNGVSVLFSKSDNAVTVMGECGFVICGYQGSADIDRAVDIAYQGYFNSKL